VTNGRKNERGVRGGAISEGYCQENFTKWVARDGFLGAAAQKEDHPETRFRNQRRLKGGGKKTNCKKPKKHPTPKPFPPRQKAQTTCL